MADVTEFIHSEAWKLLAGDKIGEGAHRAVYTCRLLPDCVLKVESDGASFRNALEWEVWHAVQNDAQAAKWFAPCVWISTTGGILVQKRTTPVAPAQLPERVPVYLTDLKPCNFGVYEGRIVQHDYALNLLMERGMSKRTKVAHWNPDA